MIQTGLNAFTVVLKTLRTEEYLISNLPLSAFILDFEKAFDTPPHEFLKCKFHRYGISGKTLVWVDSILCNRPQSVVINGAKLLWAPVLSSVPQDTVLCPLSSTLYIIYIIVGKESESRLFADRLSAIVRLIALKISKLQKDIDHLGKWTRK